MWIPALSVIRLFKRAGSGLFSHSFRGVGNSCVATFGDTRRFAAATTQIIELRTTHGALADDFDAVDVGRIEREHAFHAFTERNLANGEVRSHALVRTRDAHAFVILDTGAIAFDHLHADFQRVTGPEFGDVLLGGKFGNRLLLKRLDQVHGLSSSFFNCTPEAGQSRAFL